MKKGRMRLKISDDQFVEIPKIEIHEMECDGCYGYYTEYGCRVAVNNKGKYILTCIEEQKEAEMEDEALDYYFGQIVQRMYFVLSQCAEVPGNANEHVFFKF